MAELLDSESVLSHPYVIGEIACCRIRNRETILGELHKLDSVPSVSDKEALALIENLHVHGRGLGYIDVHLLASALITGVPLWTRDKALDAVARELEASY